MTKRILVTGATGFVGRQVVRTLADKEVELRLVIREGKEDSAKAMPKVEKVISTPDLFAEGAQWWVEQCREIDIVIHLAWYAEPGRYLGSAKNLDCLIGSLNLAKGAAVAGVKRFIGIGTCFEYDLTVGVMSVETALKPLTPYAATKAGLYLSLSQWLPGQHIEFAWCRLFYLYGEGEDSRRLVPYLRTKLEQGEVAELTSGKQIRDFLNVADAGRMITDVALGGYKGPVNICSGIPITVRQLAEQIASEYGRNDLLKFGARPDNQVDPPCVLGVSSMPASAEVV